MATKGAYKRLTKEYINIQKNPPPFITAKPSESNILEWHYVIAGPPDTPYEGGEYFGKLTFPSEYPFKPPSIRMSTPSGRFKPDSRLCLTMSDFHPSLWNPSWSVATILNGLLSFMVGDESTTGSINTTTTDKRLLAARSHQWNLRNSKFQEMYPEFCTAHYNQTFALAYKKQSEKLLAKRNTTQTNAAQQANGQHTIRNTIVQQKRWLFLFAVFIYVVLSRLTSRFSSTTDAN